MNRTESKANIAQPSANPQRTAPVTALSSAGRKGATTKSTAATSPSDNERATIHPMWPLDRIDGGADVRCRWAWAS